MTSENNKNLREEYQTGSVPAAQVKLLIYTRKCQRCTGTGKKTIDGGMMQCPLDVPCTNCGGTGVEAEVKTE